MCSTDPGDTFHRNGDFRFLTRGNATVLKHKKTGGSVEIDDLGKRILNHLPGNFTTIRDHLRTGDGVIIPEKLLTYYLLVFQRAHIIHTGKRDSQAKPRPSGRAGGEPGISIIIVTHNGEKYIAENLNSIENQSVQPEEIIIVDNASTDHTKELITNQRVPVKLIENRKNRHYARGINIGIQNARGDLFVILNQDLVLDSHFLAEIVENYRNGDRRQDIAALVPQMRFIRLRGFVNSMGNVIRNFGWGSDNYFGAVDIGQFDHLKQVKSSCFGAIAITREGWERIGRMDERYRSYYEDVDWSFRAHLKNMVLKAVPRARVYHHFGGSYDPGYRLKLVVKNRLRFVLKNFSGRIMLGFLKNHMGEDFRTMVSLLRKGNFPVFLSYASAYLKIGISVPELIVHHLKGKAAKRRQIELFFQQNSDVVILSNDRLQPVINKEVIRSYYYFAGTHG